MQDFTLIRPDRYYDSWYESLELIEAYVWDYLITCPHIDRLGIIKATPRRMASDLNGRATEGLIKAFIEKAEADGKIITHPSGAILIKAWFRHQRNGIVNERDKAVLGAYAFADQHADDPLVSEWNSIYRAVNLPNKGLGRASVSRAEQSRAEQVAKQEQSKAEQSLVPPAAEPDGPQVHEQKIKAKQMPSVEVLEAATPERWLQPWRSWMESCLVASNSTGSMSATAVARQLWHLQWAQIEYKLTDAQMAHGLREALARNKPNANYAIECAKGHDPGSSGPAYGNGRPSRDDEVPEIRMYVPPEKRGVV